MQKELNPELFGEQESQNKVFKPQMQMSLQAETQFLNFDHQIFEVRGEMNQIREEIKKMKSDITELNQLTKLRFDKISQTLTKFEHTHNGFIQEVGRGFSAVNGKIVENRSIEMKTQEMIERHNGVIKSLENRLQQMQKTLAEKEGLILNQTQALQIAKAEIARLKRL